MHLSNQYENRSENNSLIRTLFYIILSVVIIFSSLIALVISNKKFDSNINKCISTNTKLISTSNNLLLEIGSAQRRVLSLALIEDQKKQEAILIKWKTAVTNSENHHKTLVEHFKSNDPTLKLDHILQKAQKNRNIYLKSSAEFIQLIHQHKSEKQISKFLVTDLTPKFKQYRITQLALAKMLNKQFLVDSHTITKKASNTVWVIFIIALSPFFFLGYALFRK